MVVCIIQRICNADVMKQYRDMRKISEKTKFNVPDNNVAI